MDRQAPPPFPPGWASSFRATVHGTIFGERATHLSRVHAGDELLLIPGPPLDDAPGVWVHLPGGDLELEWATDGNVYMTGPAVEVFSGEWRE